MGVDPSAHHTVEATASTAKRGSCGTRVLGDIALNNSLQRSKIGSGGRVIHAQARARALYAQEPRGSWLISCPQRTGPHTAHSTPSLRPMIVLPDSGFGAIKQVAAAS